MNRKLILIANDNGLPGVRVDIENYERFFRSAQGGLWGNEEYEHEIRTFLQSSALGLHDYIMMTEGLRHVDYWLIVFCGHGRLNADHDTVFRMSDGSEVTLSQLRTWVTYSPCMVIADCCRDLVDIEGNLQQLRESMFTEIALNDQECRRIYNRALSILPAASFYTAFAASEGEYAGDNRELGGVYSYNLLNSADQVKRHLSVNMLRDDEHIATFVQVHLAAEPEVVRMRNNHQHPVCSQNTVNIPFVVVA